MLRLLVVSECSGRDGIYYFFNEKNDDKKKGTHEDSLLT